MSLSLNPARRYLARFLCLTIVATAVQTHAADIDGTSLFDDAIPIVLSATRLAQPQTEAPAAITIIDRALIKVSGAKSIPELFRLVPGMHVGYFRGNKPVVGYQGLSSEYPQGVQVLIDGRSVYSPLFGGVDWSNIPLVIEDIERIEIIRGANGASFGSNAFQAVINITSSHAVQLDGLQIKSTLGERGYQRTLMRAGHSFGDVDFRLTGSHIDDNGYNNNDDDSRQDLLTGRLDIQLTPYDSLQINAGIVNSLKETHTPGTTADPYDPPRYVDESNHSIHAKWEHSTDNSQQFITQFSYTRHLIKDKVTSFFSTSIPGFNNVVTHIDYTNEYDRFDFEMEHQMEPSENTRLSWGIGLRNDRVKQPYWIGSTQKFNNSIQRIFNNIEWRPINNIIINVGALWEHSQLSGDDLSPRIAVNYLITPYQSIRLLASRANRAPVLAENNFSTDISLNSLDVPGLVITQPLLRSQSGLDAETVDSIELGYHGIFLHNTLTFDIKLFRNEYDNLIDERGQDTDAIVTSFGVPVATIDLGFEVRTFSNLHYVNVNGFEAEFNYRPNNKNLFHAGYSYSHANVGRLIGPSSGGKKNILFSVPKDTFNLLASHTFDNDIWASAAFYYTGSMEYLDSGNPQGPMRRLDFNTGTTFNVATRQNIDIILTLQLALDKNKDFLNEFNLDNRVFVEASYSFK